MVDKQAKTSLSLEPTSFKIPFSNFKPSINKYILEEWQTSWNNSIGNKILDIKPTIGEYQSVVRNIRREEVVLARLRLGHTRVTHSYLLQGEEHPQCVGCDAPFTVRHFLLEGAQWLSGRVLDSRPKGRGFEPHRRHCVVVLEQDTFILA